MEKNELHNSPDESPNRWVEDMHFNKNMADVEAYLKTKKYLNEACDNDMSNENDHWFSYITFEI